MKKILKTLGYLLLGYFFLFSSSLMAQEREIIRGKVTYSKDKSPLPGVSVAEVDKDNRIINGTTTDMDGNYALKVSNKNNKLAFSFIGMNTSVVPISGKTIDVPMDDASKVLDEVVVVSQQKVGGLGVDQRDVTASVQRISEKDLEGIVSASVDDALQGRLAGVDITASSGDPGAGMSIRIRGASSLNASTKPLIVVDDVIFETAISGDFDFANADEDQYAQMLAIAPADIKDITVLIDASSTSRWGTKGVNGVLYITTKRGAAGKPKINYSYRGAFSLMPDPIPMLSGDEYSTLISEGYMNSRGIPLDPSSRKEFQYDPNDPWYYYNYSNNTNWIKEISQLGYDQEHNLSISGGGDKAVYRISVGYKNQTGITIGTALKRINTRVNLDYKVSDKLLFKTSFSFSRGDNDKSYIQSGLNSTDAARLDIRNMAYSRMPNMSVYERTITGENTGLFLLPETGPNGPVAAGNAQGAYPNNFNPVALAKLGQFNITNTRITPNFQISYHMGGGFNFYGTIAFDISNDKTKKFLPQTATGRPITDQNANKTEKTELDFFSIQGDGNLTYAKKFGENHDLFLSLATTIGETSTPSLYDASANTPSPYFTDPSVPSNILTLTSSTGQTRTLRSSFTGQYKLKDRYIISGGINREGNSKLSKKYRYGYFPNIGARWRVSSESFMKSLKFIDDLSLRASYAISGNLNFKQSTLSNYGTFGWDYLNVLGIYQKNPELLDLKWEQVHATDIAMDLTMKGGYLVTLDFYSRRTNDMLNDKQAVPSSSGYSIIANNIGTIRVQGWSVLLKTPIIKNKDGLNIDFSLNFANEINKWLDLSKNAQDNGQATLTIGDQNYKTIQLVDRPIGSFYGYKFIGVYKDQNATIAKDKNGNPILDASGNPVYMKFNYTATSPGYNFQAGDAMYADINHDGNINYMDVVYLGNANPIFYGGFNFGIRYKGLTCNVFFNYRVGNDIVNMSKNQLERMNSYDNQSKAVLKRWRNPGDVTDIPRALIGGNNYNYFASDRYVENGSFVRLKTTYISYTLPKTFVQKLRFDNVNIFASCTNLMTLTNYTGQDPEVKYDGGRTIGVDNSRTPRSFDINFGINAAF